MDVAGRAVRAIAAFALGLGVAALPRQYITVAVIVMAVVMALAGSTAEQPARYHRRDDAEGSPR